MALLQGKTVLITGGAAGQGRAHAVASAREGANVILVDVADPASGAFDDTIAAVEAHGGSALAIRGNVTSQADLDAAVQAGIDRFGGIDSVIANAGIHRSGLFWEQSEEDWNAVIDVNLNGVWKTVKAVAPHFIERQGGSVVLVSSVDAYDPESESTAYGVSKAAVLGLLKYLAYELAPHGARVNAVAPGFIDTAMVNSQEFYDILAGGQGLGTRQHLVDYVHKFTAMKGVSMLDAIEVANSAVYLNSSLAQYVTGVCIPVDAGHLLVKRGEENTVH